MQNPDIFRQNDVEQTLGKIASGFRGVPPSESGSRETSSHVRASRDAVVLWTMAAAGRTDLLVRKGEQISGSLNTDPDYAKSMDAFTTLSATLLPETNGSAEDVAESLHPVFDIAIKFAPSTKESGAAAARSRLTRLSQAIGVSVVLDPFPNGEPTHQRVVRPTSRRG